MLFDIVITNKTLFTNMMSIERVTFMYLYSIPGEIVIRVIITSVYAPLVVFPVRDPKFGPNISSSIMMPSLINGQLVSLFPLFILH